MKRLTLRRALFQIHLWSGLILAVPLALLGLTGSILVYHDEIDALFGAPAPALADGPARAPLEIFAAATADLPPGTVAVSFAMPREPGAPATLRIAPRESASQRRAGRIVALDPATLAIVERPAGGGRGGFDVMRMIHNLHGNFLVSGRAGRDLVGYAGVVMLGLGLSGIVLWWPRPGRWKQGFTVARKARGFRFHRELHGAAGIWGLVIFVVVSFSGVYLAFPQTLATMIGTVLPARDLRAQPAPVVPVDGATGIDLAGAVAAAAGAVGEPVLLRMANLPVRTDQSYRLILARTASPDEQPVTAYVDPWTAQVTELRDPRSFSAGEHLLSLMRPLHDGSGMGWLYRALVFVSGLLPPLFVVTGIVMWLKRGKAPASRPRRAVKPGLAE